MVGRGRCETVDPAALGAKELAALYRTHCRIFAGVRVEQFARKICNPAARWNRVRVFKDRRGEPVGYCALHRLDKTIAGEPLVIFRIETGLQREYRRRGRVFSFLLLEAFRFKFAHPLTGACVFCTLIHPSSYHLMVKFFPQVYPKVRCGTPPALFRKMVEIADAFNEVQTLDDNPALRQVGWITRQSDEERARWEESSDPDTRFFLTQNPHYGDGQGLMTLVPLTLWNLCGALGNLIRFRLAGCFHCLGRKLHW